MVWGSGSRVEWFMQHESPILDVGLCVFEGNIEDAFAMELHERLGIHDLA